MDRHAFIRFAALFEAGLAVAAVLLGAVTGVRPTNLVPDLRAAAVGVAATLPLIAFYLVATRVRLRPLQRIHDLLLSTIGRPLSECRWHELALLAALAGVCEEFLFRGVLQPLIGKLGASAGWIGANLLFGFAHAVTPAYFVLATGIGFYLSAVQAASEGNLAAAMIAHGLYDWFAFVQVSREYHRTYGDSPPPPGDAGPPEFDETD